MKEWLCTVKRDGQREEKFIHLEGLIKAGVPAESKTRYLLYRSAVVRHVSAESIC
jgi:hypothetical protein